MNLTDPRQFLLLAFAVGIVLAGLYFALREVIADAILLADKKRAAREEEEKRNRRP